MSERRGLPNPFDAAAYAIDAWQRSVLFLDVMRRRAVEYEEHRAEVAPNVLDYKAELVLDGRRLERPVNYLLARIPPPEGVTIDPKKRPFVIVDPRAGHGPGIGGFKADSEIGVAMKAGHPAYFIGFLPDPMPGQTILDITARRGGLPRDGDHPPPGGRGQALRDRQLPGRLGGDDPRRPPPRALRADHHRRDAARILGRRARPVPDALFRRPARRLVADRAGGRPRRRHLRRRGAGAELREPEPGQHPLDQAVQSLVEDRHRAGALPRLREVVGRARHAERRGDAVDRRRALRRQPPRRRRHPHAGRHRDRPAQHPLADRRLLLARRQHHAAAAGARLGPRPLRRRGRHPRPWPDHRLHDPRQGRAPRDLRLGRRRAEGARRVRLEHRPDRRAAAGPLRGGADAQGRGGRTTPTS